MAVPKRFNNKAKSSNLRFAVFTLKKTMRSQTWLAQRKIYKCRYNLLLHTVLRYRKYNQMYAKQLNRMHFKQSEHPLIPPTFGVFYSSRDTKHCKKLSYDSYNYYNTVRHANLLFMHEWHHAFTYAYLYKIRHLRNPF